jgi:hypothetical protein
VTRAVTRPSQAAAARRSGGPASGTVTDLGPVTFTESRRLRAVTVCACDPSLVGQRVASEFKLTVTPCHAWPARRTMVKIGDFEVSLDGVKLSPVTMRT